MKKILFIQRKFIIVGPILTSFICFLISIFSLLTPSRHLHAQAGMWTWMKGDPSDDPAGNFGVKGLSNPDNNPPGLYSSCFWQDHDGNFWIFGGHNNAQGMYNALWKFNPVTNNWVWMSGTDATDQGGLYGVQGIPSPSNKPGARTFGTVTWVDNDGNLWLYGGYGHDSYGVFTSLLTDLWKYDIQTNEWTWMWGDDLFSSSIPNYGALQVSSPSNSPGGREEATASWTDSTGNFWLFGGGNWGTYQDDMWKYEPGINEWTWMSGGTLGTILPVYGTKGIYDPANTPGSRAAYSRWKGSDGNFWIFGGIKSFIPTYAFYADLWKYDTNLNQWAWVSGSNISYSGGNYGLVCISDSSYFPAARYENRAAAMDSCGNFWMFGGGINESPVTSYNDLWIYKSYSNEWVLLSPFDATPDYGIKGVPSVLNAPLQRIGSPGWIDSEENFWMFGGGMIDNSLKTKNDLWKFEMDPFCTLSPLCPIFPLFEAATTALCEKFCISFIDQSTNNPTSWLWLFPGGTPSFSSDQNPNNICYNSPGIFDVTLITTNAIGNDTLSVSNYITVYPTPPLPSITQSGDILTSSPAASYQWQFNSVDIPGATNQTYIATDTGYYTIYITDQNGCSSSNTLYLEVTGIENLFSDQQISIYPNPSDGNFIVELSNGLIAETISLKVSNTLGQVIFSSEESRFIGTSTPDKKEIQLTGAGNGIYFIEIKLNDVLVRKKIIISN